MGKNKGLVAVCHSFCLFFIFYNIPYIQSSNHIHTLHSPRPLSISSSLVSSVGQTSLWCRVVMSTISERKHKRFDIEAYNRNESKTFRFGPFTIGTKAKHFDLVQNHFYCKQIFFRFGPKVLGQSKAI